MIKGEEMEYIKYGGVNEIQRIKDIFFVVEYIGSLIGGIIYYLYF